MQAKSTARETVRATVVQASTVLFDTPATLDKADRLLAEAVANGSQLVVFPEAFVGGYLRGSTSRSTIGNRTPQGRDEFRKYHASAIPVPVWGYGDGSTMPVFDTPLGKLGAVICWENRMPLLRTAMYSKGIEIYCAPTADDWDSWQATMAHIAVEGGCFVLSTNQFCRRKDYPLPPEYLFTGIEEELEPDSVVCKGGSVIMSPSGTVLAGPNYSGEALISSDLDLAEIARVKFDFDVVGHYARPDVFSLIVKDHVMNPVTFMSSTAADSSKPVAEGSER